MATGLGFIVQSIRQPKKGQIPTKVIDGQVQIITRIWVFTDSHLYISSWM